MQCGKEKSFVFLEKIADILHFMKVLDMELVRGFAAGTVGTIFMRSFLEYLYQLIHRKCLTITVPESMSTMAKSIPSMN